ncbi:MAG: hypothetical protein IJK60_06275 [Clostridia bacterium]|nr:hypothetical protein [Clostridia bacterium]
MAKRTALLLMLFVFVLLSGCSRDNNDSLLTTEETYINRETTIINNYHNNEYPPEKSSIEPVELILDDSKGHETEYYENGLFSDVYNNEKKGFTEKINYNENNEIVNYEKTVYDEKGRISCVYIYSTDKTFDYACLREYDSLGRYYRYYYYNSKCELVCYEVVTYDGYGTDLPVELYDNKGKALKEFPDSF